MMGLETLSRLAQWLKIGAWCSAVVWAAMFCTSACAVEIIAHRGASDDAPENTLAAMQLAWKQQADAIELDIRLTRDGQIVLLHDATTKRTTGLDKPITELAWDEVRRLDAGRWKDPKWTGERIPRLSDVLATVPEGKRAFVELKCGPEVLDELQRVIEASGKRPEQIVLIGFNLETMRQARQRLPKHQVYWVVGYEKDKKTGVLPKLDDVIAAARQAGFHGLDLSEKWPLDARAVGQIRQAGLQLYVWTVDDPAAAKRFASLGVDGITTNRPAAIRAALIPGTQRPAAGEKSSEGE